MLKQRTAGQLDAERLLLVRGGQTGLGLAPGVARVSGSDQPGDSRWLPVIKPHGWLPVIKPGGWHPVIQPGG